jgi:dTDP-4-dehydrorhamnose reductase
MKRPRNVAIDTAVYAAPARRPRNSRLSSVRIRDAYGISIRPWQESLPAVLDEILSP